MLMDISTYRTRACFPRWISSLAKELPRTSWVHVHLRMTHSFQERLISYWFLLMSNPQQFLDSKPRELPRGNLLPLLLLRWWNALWDNRRLLLYNLYGIWTTLLRHHMRLHLRDWRFYPITPCWRLEYQFVTGFENIWCCLNIPSGIE